MSDKINYAEKIKENFNKELLKEFPRDLLKLAKHLELDVQSFIPTSEKEKNVRGAINKNKKTIFVNATEHPLWQRSVIAHELGHFVLHPKGNKGNIDFFIIDNDNKDSFDIIKEEQANNFAKELLMPREKVNSLISKLDPYFDKIKKVTTYFDVSSAKSEERLKDLNLL